ncbi:Chlorophyllase-1 [Hibiscus syriacus]|uniref:Chlorophyllase-1 n=1 Tax=Hibiscus syriacus TaxID=106335 RepID=A0A6A2Z0L4_HIBSY|nr:Chlorophyllase-1 [Hibiscus syriacus]
MYTFMSPSGMEEVESTAKVADWLQSGLQSLLPDNTTPNILTYEPNSFNISIPVTVIGTGLGSESKGIIMQCPCAPKKFNHEEFFNECKLPRAHFNAKDYGHKDMLDDDPSGLIGKVADNMCVNGKGPRDPMRRCVGGILVAFLNYYFQDNKVDFDAIVNEPSVAPVVLDQVQFDTTIDQKISN